MAVGAPYYGVNNQGAVFVYRTKYGTEELELSQTVLPSNRAITTSFGMKLSDVLENNSGVARGFGIAAPEADVMTYVRARPVVRFRDDTMIEVTPTIIRDPRNNPQIMLSVKPKVVKLSDYNNDISIKVTVTTDNGRLEAKQPEFEILTLIGGNNEAKRLQFKYSLRDSTVYGSSYSPIRFDSFGRKYDSRINVSAFLSNWSTVCLLARAPIRIHVQLLIQKMIKMERIQMKKDRKFSRKQSQQ